MIVVTSAAYIGHEFRSEFGAIPPCMLPIGNRRLYEHQLGELNAAFPEESIHVSLPESFPLSEADAERFSCASADIVRVPDNVSLAEAVLYVINSVGRYDDQLRILHGDTLIYDIPGGKDVIAVSATQNDYNWEVESIGGKSETVWSGFFSFSDVRLLARTLTLSRCDFGRAVHAYGSERPLERIAVGQWLDLGHVNTYYASRARMTTERSFNELHIDCGEVRKSGSDERKIRSEIYWYNNVPPSIRRYCPQLLECGESDGRPFYSLEYLYLPPLNELYVHGRNPPFFWDNIFSRIDQFLDACAAAVDPAGMEVIQSDTDRLFGEKTWKRLADFSAQRDFDIDHSMVYAGEATPSLRAIAAECIDRVQRGKPAPGMLHGDLCFSNILFDGRAGDIKVIDPRGANVDGEMTIYGDLRYDLAKLSHSVLGLYDFIVADAIQLEQSGMYELHLGIHVERRVEEVQSAFSARKFLGDRVAIKDIYPHMILLFLSMLPLHADKPQRQMAFVANALRLYLEMEAEE
ncbi:aminoglycoside phosphotransferase family protein [Alcanivorax sp. JB21]|uniref:aminoglycoside phosphotransferase family protein n=1 Tax=Alcanivorax limicola TaxID=2874102 RepID=UPI001CBFFB0C|nr:aminoglycoside phosphotransferase family protein [Alcanivorax limicola]MBZ2190300.1 aminoglycoside phosphotransferase family protein [Alcanivorax limicola]